MVSRPLSVVRRGIALWMAHQQRTGNNAPRTRMKFEYTGSHFRVVVELLEVHLDFAQQRGRQPKLKLAQVIRRIKQK